MGGKTLAFLNPLTALSNVGLSTSFARKAFGISKTPGTSGVAGVPTRETAAEELRKKKTLERFRSKRGRAATILTGPQGIVEGSALASKTLLGGGT